MEQKKLDVPEREVGDEVGMSADSDVEQGPNIIPSLWGEQGRAGEDCKMGSDHL